MSPGALLRRFILIPLREIDSEAAQPSQSLRTPEFKALVTVLLTGVILTFNQYIVLRGAIQGAVSEQLPDLIGLLFGASAGEWLGEYRSLLRNITWSLGCSFFYVVLPALVVKTVFQEELCEWGLSPNNYFRHLWIYALLFLPVLACVIAVSYTPEFQNNYPFYKQPQSWRDLLVWECFYALQFFCLEFFFRGFMLHGLRERYGSGAIYFMIVPYCMIHFQKPFLETLGAIIAGLVLGILALRTRSIWGGATIHVAVAVSMDIAALVQTDRLPSSGF
jgi:membrane protease YdiL (CAAX protease family)